MDNPLHIVSIWNSLGKSIWQNTKGYAINFIFGTQAKFFYSLILSTDSKYYLFS